MLSIIALVLIFLCSLATLLLFLGTRKHIADMSLCQLHQSQALSNINTNLTMAIASLPKKRAKRVESAEDE